LKKPVTTLSVKSEEIEEFFYKLLANNKDFKALCEKINGLEDHLNIQMANFHTQTRYYYYEQEKINLLENHVRDLDEKINNLEKRLLEAEDQRKK
jgi:ribosomal protein S15P/S13E